MFKTMQEAQDWIETESKKYPSKNAFYASSKYHKAYPLIKKLSDDQCKKKHALKVIEAEKAMKEAGVKFGDSVFYDYVCIFNVITYEGKIINRKGIPYVKFDNNMTINGKKSIRWHKGFMKKENQN